VAAFFKPPRCLRTALTIFCSSIKNARTILHTQNQNAMERGKKIELSEQRKHQECEEERRDLGWNKKGKREQAMKLER